MKYEICFFRISDIWDSIFIINDGTSTPEAFLHQYQEDPQTPPDSGLERHRESSPVETQLYGVLLSWYVYIDLFK